ncbi:MAG: PIG-L deacetylase family protein [Micrococcus sp.]|nr:PIG-L deacetylase family protein [Micrococcus sp.]
MTDTTPRTAAALAAHRSWRTVLAFGAHPDDLDFGAAATLAGLAAAGCHVVQCVVTDGDAGGFDSEGPAAMTARRHAEQRAAAAALGVAEVRFLGERDGYLEPTHAVREKIVAVMREVRPDVVVSTHPERDYSRLQRAHPDHLACGEAVVSAAYPAVENPYAYPDLAARGLEAFRVRDLLLYGGPAARENLAVDVTGWVETKLEALMAHVSQHPDVARMQDFVRQQLAATHARFSADEAGDSLSAPPTELAAEAFHLVEVNAPDTIAGF